MIRRPPRSTLSSSSAASDVYKRQEYGEPSQTMLRSCVNAALGRSLTRPICTRAPEKLREMHNHHFDSEKWEGIALREDDVVIATAYKSGTSWMQNIVLRLVHQGSNMPENPAEACPWLDLRVPPLEVQGPMLDSVQHRRQLKTHLRLDALKYDARVKYIYIGRDGRDCYMSLVNHWRKGNDLWYQILNDSPGRVGEGIPRFDEGLHSEKLLFDRWIGEGWASLEGETDGWPWWSLFDNVKSWWDYRHMPNILFIHFNDLLNDLDGEVRKVADFLEIDIDEHNAQAMMDSLTFASMKTAADDPQKTLVPLAGAIFEGGGGAFINKGTNGRWQGVLSRDQLTKYDQVSTKKLEPECKVWLEQGLQSGVDPNA
eukprot:TRINITY_DN4297_c0_g2_i1.p1 TRINITY_DN4297_c0_g2~~TRINITY_DN4297_c0_g2_i1.p1  ORF type:complete len:371 (+),score=71.44 TRINITY_DN4297_c0_g2_i1:145-1257(+)